MPSQSLRLTASAISSSKDTKRASNSTTIKKIGPVAIGILCLLAVSVDPPFAEAAAATEASPLRSSPLPPPPATSAGATASRSAWNKNNTSMNFQNNNNDGAITPDASRSTNSNALSLHALLFSSESKEDVGEGKKSTRVRIKARGGGAQQQKTLPITTSGQEKLSITTAPRGRSIASSNTNYNTDNFNGAAGGAGQALVAYKGGVCPANGNTHVIYVTTHIGTNIESYDTFGRYLGPMIKPSSVPSSVGLQKLRGMLYGPDGLLYVAASRASYSRIFALSPTGLPLPLRPKRSSDEAQLQRRRRLQQQQQQSKSISSPSSTSTSVSVGDKIAANIKRLQQEENLEQLLANKGEEGDDVGADGEGSDLYASGGGSRGDLDGRAHGGLDEGGGEQSEEGVGDRIAHYYYHGGGSGGSASKYIYRYGGEEGDETDHKNTNNNKEELLLSPASPELAFLSGEQRMALTLPKRYRMNSDCTRNYVYTLAKLDETTNPNMNHPYAFFFHPEDGTMFVTNQNSITVTRYVGPTTTRRQLYDLMAAAAGVLRRTPKITVVLKGLLRSAAPIAEGDPVPFSGGASGYAGMPLPPSYTILRALQASSSSSSSSSSASSAAAERYASMHRAGNNNNNDGNINNNGSTTVVGFSLLVTDNTPGSSLQDSLLSIEGSVPSKAIGVFASGWCPFYNLLSVRGMAISPRMLYSVTDKMFVHDMEVIRVNTPVGVGRGGRYSGGGGGGGGRGGASSSSNGNRYSNSYNGNSYTDLSAEKRAGGGGGKSGSDGGFLSAVFGGLGDLLFGASSIDSSAAASQQKHRTTIRRRIDLSSKTVIGLRVILVADVIGNAIHVFHEHSGELMWSYTNVVRQPIQIHFPKSGERTSTSGDYWFYVTCKDGSVYKLHLRKPSAVGESAAASSAVLLIKPNAPMRAVSGFHENPTHNTLFIADRKGRSIHTYTTPELTTQSKELYYTGTFARRLVGEPEHLLYTSVVSQRHIPFCYELNHDGTLRFSALCYAAQLWFLMGLAGLIVAFFAWTRIGRAIAGACCGFVCANLYGNSKARGAANGSSGTSSTRDSAAYLR